jgi:RHS repeat-associated protein
MNEQLGYAYDRAWNVNYRTNGALVQTFNLDALNQLTTLTRSGALTVVGTTTSGATNVIVNGSTAIRYVDNTFARTNVTLTDGTNTFTAIAQDSSARAETNTVTTYLPATASFAYDGNGNLITNGTRVFEYDDENQLIRITEPNSLKSEFTYDGKMRRRIRREYAWQLSNWRLANEVHYIYDGNLVIHERDPNNLPMLAYTRGNDVSGSLEGAGGVGGLLARSDQPSMSSQQPTSFYHNDGNGNVTMIVNSLQLAVATYLYDPFGNTLSYGGARADANHYRFSSQHVHPALGLVNYGYRDYDPTIQRWLARDPLGDRASLVLAALRSSVPPVSTADEQRIHRRGLSRAVGVTHSGTHKRGLIRGGADGGPYAFTRNSPTVAIDPLGLFSLWFGICFGNLDESDDPLDTQCGKCPLGTVTYSASYTCTYIIQIGDVTGPSSFSL